MNLMKIEKINLLENININNYNLFNIFVNKIK